MVQFEWDERKAASNLAKHRVAFDQAISVFNDPHQITFEDLRSDYGEVRLNTIGAIDSVVFVCVVHTNRSGITRLISARPASRRERKIYNAHSS